MSPEAWTLPWEEAREGLVVHRDRQVVYLNPAAAELLAVDREKVRGLPLILALRDHRLEALALEGERRCWRCGAGFFRRGPARASSTSWT